MKQHTQQRRQSKIFYYSTTTNQPAAHITYSLPSGWCDILCSVFPICHWRTIQMSCLKFWLVLHFHMGQSSNKQNICGIQDKPWNKTSPTVNCLAGKGLGERHDKVNKQTHQHTSLSAKLKTMHACESFTSKAKIRYCV